MPELPAPAPLLLALLAAGCAASAGSPRPPLDPRTMVPPGIRKEWLHFQDPVVGPGEGAPPFTLPTPDGRTAVPLDLFRGRPLVLIFGSWT